MIRYKESEKCETLDRYIRPEKTTQRKQVLNLLKKDDFVPTKRLRLFSYQYNARIYELRKLGYIIERASQDGKCGFKLLGSNQR